MWFLVFLSLIGAAPAWPASGQLTPPECGAGISSYGYRPNISPEQIAELRTKGKMKVALRGDEPAIVEHKNYGGGTRHWLTVKDAQGRDFSYLEFEYDPKAWGENGLFLATATTYPSGEGRGGHSTLVTTALNLHPGTRTVHTQLAYDNYKRARKEYNQLVEAGVPKDQAARRAAEVTVTGKALLLAGFRVVTSKIPRGADTPMFTVDWER